MRLTLFMSKFHLGWVSSFFFMYLQSFAHKPFKDSKTILRVLNTNQIISTEIKFWLMKGIKTTILCTYRFISCINFLSLFWWIQLFWNSITWLKSWRPWYCVTQPFSFAGDHTLWKFITSQIFSINWWLFCFWHYRS